MRAAGGDEQAAGAAPARGIVTFLLFGLDAAAANLATVKLADPLPLPVCPKLIVIQLTFEVTGLGQLVALATILMVPSPPAIGKDWGEAVTVNVQV